MIGVFPDGHKHLLALDLCGGESFAAWKGCLDDLVARGLRAPVLAIIESVADTKALRPRSPRPWPGHRDIRCHTRTRAAPGARCHS